MADGRRAQLVVSVRHAEGEAARLGAKVVEVHDRFTLHNRTTHHLEWSEYSADDGASLPRSVWAQRYPPALVTAFLDALENAEGRTPTTSPRRSTDRAEPSVEPSSTRPRAKRRRPEQMSSGLRPEIAISGGLA